MLTDTITLRAQLVASGTPQLPGTGGPIKVGARRELNLRSDDAATRYLCWSMLLGAISAANNPVVNMLTGTVTLDGATVTGNPGKDAEGVTLPEALNVFAVLLEVLDATVTITNEAPDVIATLEPGTYLFEREVGLGLWSQSLTFAGVGGTAQVKLTVASAYSLV